MIAKKQNSFKKNLVSGLVAFCMFSLSGYIFYSVNKLENPSVDNVSKKIEYIESQTSISTSSVSENFDLNIFTNQKFIKLQSNFMPFWKIIKGKEDIFNFTKGKEEIVN